MGMEMRKEQGLATMFINVYARNHSYKLKYL